MGPATRFCFWSYLRTSRILSRSKQGGDIFTTACLKPPGNCITNRKEQEKIIKQPFRVNHVPPDLDAIIIGSGGGGLSTAVLLSKVGKKVLVLEQHDCAGGKSHMFSDKGFQFDTGVHYVGNMDGTLYRTLSDQLTNGQVQWDLIDDVIDVVAMADREKVRLYPRRAGKENYIEDLVKEFPEEEAAIKRFYELLDECDNPSRQIAMLKLLPKWLASAIVTTGIIGLIFPSYVKYGKKTLQSVLDELTSNSDLKTIFSYMFGNHAVNPERSPFALHAEVMMYYMDGAYYPRGGTTQFALNMIPIIEKQGGRVLTQAPVTQILVNSSGYAYGVKVRSELDGEVVIQAPVIVSSAGALNTFKTLLPKQIATRLGAHSASDQTGASTSYMTLYLGLKGSAEELGLKASNTWAFFYSDTNTHMQKLETMSAEEAKYTPFPYLFIGFPSAKDSLWRKENPDKSSATVIIPARYEWFEECLSRGKQNGGDDYEDLKNEIGKTVWQQCIHIFPQLKDKLEYLKVGSPAVNKDYMQAERGGIYGLRQTSLFKPETVINLGWKTDIPGLYFAGQDSFRPGLLPAFMSGVFCASKILKRQLIFELENFHESLNKPQ